MISALSILHVVAGLIVLAEALNKLERCHPLDRSLTLRERVIDVLKALAWLCLALGAGGAVATPVLLSMGLHPAPWQTVAHQQPSLAETCIMLGTACHIFRARVKEG